MRIALHVQDSRYQGIRPSHLEGIRELCLSYGVSHVAMIDCTPDGCFEDMSGPGLVWERRTTLPDGPLVAIESPQRSLASQMVELDSYAVPTDDPWHVFGPAYGLDASPPWSRHVWIPGANLEARDALAIFLYATRA